MTEKKAREKKETKYVCNVSKCQRPHELSGTAAAIVAKCAA